MTGIAVSVVVPTFHREKLLDRCLNALVQQNLDPSRYEIIIIDDGNSLETRQVVEKWTERTSAYRFLNEMIPAVSLRDREYSGDSTVSMDYHPGMSVRMEYLPLVRYIPMDQGKHGPAAARNYGWQCATGEVIAFTDDDCIPQPDWLKEGLQAIESGADGASGQVIVPLKEHPTDYELNARGLERSEFVTASCFYRKDILLAAGGFDERFTLAWREDTDLYFSLKELGCRLVRVPSAVVLHPVRPASWGISLRQQRKNEFNALLYKKHAFLYRKIIQKQPPIRYYASNLSLIAAAVSWAAHAPGLVGAFLLAWLLLTLAFCSRRLLGTSKSPGHILEMLVTSVLIPPIAVYWRIRGAIRYQVLFL